MKTEMTIKKAEYISDYKIAFEFSDGHKSVLDLFSFMSAKGQNPMATKYLDKKRFANFKILGKRDISWNRNEMCFSFNTIYNGGEVKAMTMNEKIEAIKKIVPPSKLKYAIRELEKQFA